MSLGLVSLMSVSSVGEGTSLVSVTLRPQSPARPWHTVGAQETFEEGKKERTPTSSTLPPQGTNAGHSSCHHRTVSGYLQPHFCLRNYTRGHRLARAGVKMTMRCGPGPWEGASRGATGLLRRREPGFVPM